MTIPSVVPSSFLTSTIIPLNGLKAVAASKSIFILTSALLYLSLDVTPLLMVPLNFFTGSTRISLKSPPVLSIAPV